MSGYPGIFRNKSGYGRVWPFQMQLTPSFSEHTCLLTPSFSFYRFFVSRASGAEYISPFLLDGLANQSQTGPSCEGTSQPKFQVACQWQ